jgi:hypothetical protein
VLPQLAILKFTFYCDQPIVSETTRCVSDDFIKTIDDQGQNARVFYAWGKRSGREQESGETERERVREIERAGEKDSVGEISGHSRNNRQKCNMIIRMFAVKRWTFLSNKLFVTVFFNEGHFRSDYKVADV